MQFTEQVNCIVFEHEVCANFCGTLLQEKATNRSGEDWSIFHLINRLFSDRPILRCVAVWPFVKLLIAQRGDL